MQVSMSNQKSIESAIKNLEVQVGQLAKQLADRPSRSFGANTEKNPKEECKAVMTRSKMVSMNEGEKRIGEEKHPESKIAKGKDAISSFHQFPDESLSEALERFHGLLRKTPTHGFSKSI